MEICRNYDDNGSEEEAAKPFLLIHNDDILCEILSRLPMKSLMCCKSVCKHWLSLINQRDRGLIDSHLARSKSKATWRPSLLITCDLVIACDFDYESDYLLEGDTITKAFGTVSVEDLFEGGATAVHWFTTTLNMGVLRYSVNGLLCFVDLLINSVQIFNPSTREMTPPIETIYKARVEVEEHGVKLDRRPHFGFGCDSYGKEHKVVCLWEFYRSTAEHQPIGCERICEVMTVGDNTWRRIDAIPPPFVTQIDSVTADGFIFWMNAHTSVWEAPDCDALVRFDVASEKFSLIKIPNHVLGEPQPLVSSRCIELFQVDGRIAVLHRDTNDCKVTLLIIDRLDKVVNHDDSTSATSAAWNGTVYTSKWIEETISIPFDDWDGGQCFHFLPVAGTDHIIMEPVVLPRFNSVILYCYDRKKKTSKKVEISGIYSFIGFDPISSSINLIIESLLAVQNKKQKQ